MKKTTAAVLSFLIIITSLVIPSVTAEAETYEDYSWQGTSQVYAASKSARYFRTKELSDGSVGAVYYRSGIGNYFAISYNGGVTFEKEVLLLPNATDSENPESTFVTKEQPYGRGRLEAQNPNLIQLENGDIMVFHRYNTYTGEPEAKPWSIYYSSIVYQVSSDMGASWSEPKVMVNCTKTSTSENPVDGYGLWEPDPYLINGKLFIYYADTYTPNNLAYQHIMYCIWDEKTDTFSAPEIAQNGIDHLSRDGMSVVTALNDGSYAMVFESTKTANTDNTFVIKMSLSRDGKNWTQPVIVAAPDTVLSATAASTNEKAVCASPHIITLPDGRVAVSYQTTDRYTGIIPDRVSYRVVPEIIVSKTALGYNSFDNLKSGMSVSSYVNARELFTPLKNGPDDFKADTFGKSASMLYTNGRLMVYYNIGTNNDANTHIFKEVMVSYAKTGLDTDYTDINNFNAYNSSNNAILESNGTFTIPSGTSSMLVSNKNASVPIDISYKSEDFTLFSTKSAYSATFNPSNKSIKTTSTGKAKLNNTEYLSSFKASMDIEGNPTSGFTKGGFAFHIQDSDFNNNYFNTSGYSVFARRETDSLNTVSIVYRYCTNGSSVYSYVAGSYENLDPKVTNYKFTLELVVTEDKFYAQLKDESGKIIVNAKEAPLNEKQSGKSTKYYPTGSLAIINDLTHTFSNIQVTKTYELVKTDYLKATATFTIAETGNNQVGFALRAQNSIMGSPGYDGFVVKLVNNSLPDGQIGLQLTRYGTNSSGQKYVNLGNIKTYTDKTVLDGASPFGATIIMEAELEGKDLTVTISNPDNSSLSSTYSFDLSKSSGYTADYQTGGFGFFNHSSNKVYVRDIYFSTEKTKAENLNFADFSVFQPYDNIKYENHSFLSTDTTAKKIMLKNSFTSDFSANATFTVADNGELKTGIIFRAQSLGNQTHEIEGYAVALIKRANNENNGKIQFNLYKWVRSKTGELSYYSNLISTLYDDETLNSVYPECEKSVLASIEKRIKLNVTVAENIVTASFDIVDEKGNILASSPKNLSYNLTKKRTPSATGNFTSDGANTLFGAGQIGVYMSTRSRFCDLSLTTNDDPNLDSKKLSYATCDNGLIYTTLCSGAADEGKLVKVISIPDEGYHLSVLNKTVNGITQELSLTNGEYSFVKENGATNIWAIFRKNGDLNEDNFINSLDLSDMRKLLLNIKALRLSDADLSQDGIINIIDLIQLKKLTATPEQ